MEDFRPANSGGRGAARRKSSFGLDSLVAVILLSGSTVRAQEALHSALALDSVQSSAAESPMHTPAEISPDQGYLGPVKYMLGTYASAEANDNVNLSQNTPRSDTILSSGLNIGLTWPATQMSELHFSMQAGYAKYLAQTANDRVEIAPGSALTWSVFFEDCSLTFFDQFNYSQNVITEASVTGTSSIPQADNTVGVRASWNPGHWQWEVDYSHNITFSDDKQYQYLNRASEYFLLRGARLLAEDAQIGLEASASLTVYELASQSGNTSYSLGPYLEWPATHFINLSLRGGYTLYAFDSSAQAQPAQNLNAYYLKFQLSHKLTELVSQQLSVDRSVNLGLNHGNNYTEEFAASYSVNWAATANLNLNLALRYEIGNQPLNGPTGHEQENYDRIGVTPSLSYQITKKMAGTLTYSHWGRTSNLNGNNYRNNSLKVQLDYVF